MGSHATIKRAALAVALLFTFASGAGPAQAAPRDDSSKLLVSIYDNEVPADAALRALKSARDRGAIASEAYALVIRDASGKVKLRERRARGTRGGQTVAAVGGVLGVRTGTGLGASATEATDYLMSNVVGMQKELVDSLRDTLPVGGAALVTTVDGKSAAAASEIQEAGAARVLSYDFPDAIPKPAGVREPPAPVQRPAVVPGSP
jgi:uncharacterized membrane protein